MPHPEHIIAMSPDDVINTTPNDNKKAGDDDAELRELIDGAMKLVGKIPAEQKITPDEALAEGERVIREYKTNREHLRVAAPIYTIMARLEGAEDALHEAIREAQDALRIDYVAHPTRDPYLDVATLVEIGDRYFNMDLRTKLIALAIAHARFEQWLQNEIFKALDTDKMAGINQQTDLLQTHRNTKSQLFDLARSLPSPHHDETT